MYDQAVRIVPRRGARRSRSCSATSIGYNRAARLIEQMESAGLVSPMQTNGNREVLVRRRPNSLAPHRIRLRRGAPVLGRDGRCARGRSRRGTAADGALKGLTSFRAEFRQRVKEGYEVWQELTNADGGLLGRDVELTDQGRRLQPEHDRRRLQRADQPGRRRPAAGHVLVAAQPARLRGRRAQPDALRRAGRRVAGDLHPRLQVPVLRPAGHGRQAGRRVRHLARRRCPRTSGRRRRPTPPSTTRSPLPTSEGIEAILSENGIETVYRETYSIDTKNFDTIVNAMKAEDPDIVVNGAQTEDGIGMLRAMLKADFEPDWLYQTNAPVARRPVLRRGRGREHRGRLLLDQPLAGGERPRATRSSSRSTTRCSAAPRPRTRPTRYAAGQVLTAAVEAVGSIDDQLALADWLRENEVDTILGPLSWNDDGSPIGEFLTGQWQNGERRDRAARGGRHQRQDRHGLGARRRQADGAVRPEPRPGRAAGRCLRPGGGRADADLRRHEDHQPGPGRVPHPGRLHQLHVVVVGGHRPAAVDPHHHTGDLRARLGRLPAGGLADPYRADVVDGAAHVRAGAGARGRDGHDLGQQLHRDPARLRRRVLHDR